MSIRRRTLLLQELVIDEAEVSMLTVDGSSGANTYQLTALGLGDLDITKNVNWLSSNPSAVTVTPGGLCTCVGEGISTIYASRGGVQRECIVRGYNTKPTPAQLRGLGGGKGCPGFKIDNSFPVDLTDGDISSHLLRCMVQRVAFQPGPGTRAYGSSPATFFSTSSTGRVIVYAVRDDGITRTQIAYTSPDGLITPDLVDSEFYFDGYKFRFNSNAVNMTFTDSSISTSSGRQFFDFNSLSGVVKNTVMSSAPAAAGNTQMYTPAQCKRFHCAQDFIRYTDRVVGGVTRSNYIKIPNRGLLGIKYDLYANNTPAEWFNI